MKLILLFVLAFLFQVQAREVYAQTVSISKHNVSIVEVFREIKKQTKYNVISTSKHIDETPLVSIEIKDASLKEVLDKLLTPVGLSYETENHSIVIKKALYPARIKAINKAITVVQQQQVTGKVTDQNGEPLPGVSIRIKGKTADAITNDNGLFSISVQDGDVLMFSYVGFASHEEHYSGQGNMNVVLVADIQNVGEVVVVGYGTQKKVNLTGAVSSLNVDEKITNRALTNISSGLSGLMPGLSVNQNSGMAGKNNVSLLIRGLGTVNNASPLVVVDGMPDIDINRINPNDIENISVLKDATSSAVYGSRAANGVILITTKSGKGQAKTSINVSSSYAVEKPTRVFNFMADYPRALTLQQRLIAVNTLREDNIFKDGTIDQWMALGMIDPIGYPNTDWWNVIMRDGVLQNHNISASGSNDKSNFFISAGVMDEKGLQINNDFSRYNARFNYDYKIRDNINVGARFSGNWSKYIYSLSDGFTSNGGHIDLQYAIAGILPYDPETGYFGGVMAYNEDPQAYNPYSQFVNNLNHQNQQEVAPSVYIDWSPLDGLTARIDYAINYSNQFRWSAAIPARAYNFQTASYGSRIYVGENAGVSNYTNTEYKTQLNGRLNYQKIFAERHDFSVLFVYSEEYWNERYQGGSRNDRLHPSLHEIDAALTDIQSASGNSSTEGLRSFIGRVNYVAFDKYLVEANFRYDGSSKFLPGSQFGFFPSVALGWRFTEENFMESTKGWLDNGKIRASYGGLGNNSGVDRYEQQETLGTSPYMIGNSIAKGFVNSKMINQNLTWEKTSVLNIGLDLGFLNNRLTSEIDYYDRLTTGMNRPSDLSILLTGAYTAPRRNIGNLRNRGIEGNFTWRDRIGEFNYSLNLNASYNSTVLEEWNEYLGRGWVFLDMPYHFLYTYEDIGIAQTWQDIFDATPQGASPGDILRKDLNGDGRIDDNDKKAYAGTQRDRPTTNFGLNAYFAWKGFDLGILLQGAAGRKDYWLNIYNNVNFNSTRYASSIEHWEKPWAPDNRGGGWPRLGGNGNVEETTFWLDDMSYLRLKNIQLGYKFPAGWIQRVGIDNLRIFVTAENLATLTSYRGLDPEKQSNKSDAYPLNKSFSFGINIGI